jgi:hypothetical protein
MNDDEKSTVGFIIRIVKHFIMIVGGVVLFVFAVEPIYNVWEQQKCGEAELARADSNRKIRTLEALAEQEASKALAEAEVIRAQGVARANEIIGSSLKDNEGYLRYLWIQGLKTNDKEVVYVATEANLPILEANRLKKGIEK